MFTNVSYISNQQGEASFKLISACMLFYKNDQIELIWLKNLLLHVIDKALLYFDHKISVSLSIILWFKSNSFMIKCTINYKSWGFQHT